MTARRTEKADITQETRKIFQKALGENDKRPPKGAKYHEFKQYLENRYDHFPEGILFDHAKNHERASVDGGNKWVTLGGRHPSKIGTITQERVVAQLSVVINESL